MHQPRPFGLHVENGELTKDDLSFINHQALRLTNLKDLSGVDSLKMVYDLPDGGVAILQDAGGIFKVIADKQRQKDSDAHHYSASIPMLLSGVITNAWVKEDEPTGVKITQTCRRRLNGYEDTKLPPQELLLHRLTIGNTSPLTDQFISQYVSSYPTWYSGAMAEVVQIIAGYGRGDVENLPDKPYEKNDLNIPLDVTDRIAEEIHNSHTYCYDGVVRIDGKIIYRFGFNVTHGVAFDDDNKPWLIKFNSLGVWAMPLPLITGTTTSAFYDYIEEMGDDEILAILDKFGGMPSGEDFPEGDAFQAWYRAGVIIKVCDTADFYHHIGYATGIGWSFNLRGSEAYNTCYNYDDKTGIGIGYTYKAKLNFKKISTPNKGGASDNKLINDYINRLLGALVDLPRYMALSIGFKIRYATWAELSQRVYNSIDESEINYWHNLTVKPIAAHTGNVVRVYQGYLYHHAKLKFQPQFKFPEPMLAGCVSHDFLPISGFPYGGKPPNCDTIMFAYYIGDDLKTIKYFVDWGSYTKQTDSDFEPYMYVGSWQKHEYIGATGVQGYFYGSDIDDREEVSPTETLTTVVGKDQGYDKKPMFSYHHFFGMTGSMWRNRYYTHLTTTTSNTGNQISLAVCVPYLTRNMALFAKTKTISNQRKTVNYSLGSVKDPNTYTYWTYDSVSAWHSMYISSPKGSPYPVNGNPVWVELYNYSPSEANEWADNGDWVGGLPADYTWLIHPKSNEWLHGGGGGAPNIKPYYASSDFGSVSTGRVVLSGSEQPLVCHNRIPDSWYYVASPSDFGDFFYKDATKICFGESEYINTSELNEYNQRAHQGYTKLADHNGAHFFIGVINE